eukprot:scaffold1693_cov109-Isochrysis_galbana.AAC.4
MRAAPQSRHPCRAPANDGSGRKLCECRAPRTGHRPQGVRAVPATLGSHGQCTARPAIPS